MVEVKGNELVFAFPDVSEAAVLRVHFRNIASPAVDVPIIHHADDRLLLGTVGPVAMHLRPGFVVEELRSRSSEPGPGLRYPFAVLVSVGGLNALTGKPSSVLSCQPQNYFSSPPQGGIDGYLVAGQVNPFRAGAEPHLNSTRLEIKVLPMKNKVWDYFMSRRALIPGPGPFLTGLMLKHGGERQCEPVYEDLCSIGDWDQDQAATGSIWLRGRS